MLKRLKKFLSIHLVLIAGSVLFSFPFFWLISTSLKEEEEVFRLPPKWLPALPDRVGASPYISARGIEPVYRPSACDGAKWAAIKPQLERVIDERLAAGLPDSFRSLSADSKETPSSTGRKELLTAARQAAWERIFNRIPTTIWTRDDETIKQTIARLVTPQVAAEAAGRVVKRQMVGSVFATDRQWAETKLAGPIVWRPEDPQGAGQGQSPQLMPWRDLENPDDFTLLKYRLGGAGTIRYATTLTLPLAFGDLKQLSFDFKNDDSCHEVDFRIQSRTASYHSRQPFLIDNANFQLVILTLAGDAERNVNALTMVADGPGDPSLKDNQAAAAFTIRPVSYPKALWNKFSRNFRLAFAMVPFWRFTGVSVYLCVMNIALMLLSCSLVAFAFARLKWPGRDFFFMLAISTMMLPPQVTMIPVFVIIKHLGWYNSLKPLWAPAIFGSAFYIFLLRQFLLGLPGDLEDAAKIDGCGYVGIWRNIALPLMKPALATIAIFQFMGTWNDFMGPVIYVNKEALTPLSLGLFMFRAVHGGDFGLLMAASLIMTLPVVFIFFFAQRYFIQGITLTGMKG